MSFSKEVKEELSKQIPTARHCQIAEIAAIISLCGRIAINIKNEYFIKIYTENLTVARKYFILIKKTFRINAEISIRHSRNSKKGTNYCIVIKKGQESIRILRATKLIDHEGEIKENLSIISNLVLQNTCCKRAFLRGAFLAAGSISAPEKTYHFEIATPSQPKSEQVRNIMKAFHLDAKIVRRKKYYVVYLKEGAQIVDVLNVMEAPIALMNLENVRILKEMRNSINRQVNCETANINKTVVAATKQIDDIKFIRDVIGFSQLSEGLEEIARLRIEQPDASLKELGALLYPPIGKSGVNHRLRKLSIIAERLREQKEEMKNGNKDNHN